MNLNHVTAAAALVAVLGTAVVYGTDVFCAMVLRPALASVDDRALVAVAAGFALILLLVWLALYTRVSAPINRQLTAAADAGETLSNGRALQKKWDSIIGLRALLQGLAVAALCVVLVA